MIHWEVWPSQTVKIIFLSNEIRLGSMGKAQLRDTARVETRVLNQSPSLYKFQVPVVISRWIARCSYYDGYAVYYYICVIHFVRVHSLQYRWYVRDLHIVYFRYKSCSTLKVETIYDLLLVLFQFDTWLLWRYADAIFIRLRRI